MRKSFAFIPIAAFVLMGCGDKDEHTGDTGPEADTDTDTDTDTDPVPELSVIVDWTDDGEVPTDTDGDTFPDTGCGDTVTITITDPLGETAWFFGMAETGSAAGWFGEDCIGGDAGFDLCHGIGISTTLDEVTDCSVNSVVAGTSTLFDAAKDPHLTYYLEDSAGNCFVFGDDTAYYGVQNCTEMAR